MMMMMMMKASVTASEQTDAPCLSPHHSFLTESAEQVPGEAEPRPREELVLLDQSAAMPTRRAIKHQTGGAECDSKVGVLTGEGGLAL